MLVSLYTSGDCVVPFPSVCWLQDTPPTWGVSLIDSRVSVGSRGDVVLQLFDGKKIVVFPHTRGEADKWVEVLSRASRRKIGNYYGVTGLIGMGSFAEVRIGYDKATSEPVAIKVMKKNKRDSELMRSVECEIGFVSKAVDHPNVVKTYDCFDTRDNLFLVLEHMAGGMLYDVLAKEGYFSEATASGIMRDLLAGVACLHAHDIVHRDIKPENVLAVRSTFPLTVKVADFGLADFVLETSFGDKCTNGMYGTPFFVAPEVIRGEPYGPAVDCWSCGVLLYNMLSGTLPFDGANIKDVLRRVRSGSYDLPDSEWADISPAAKDLVAGLLFLDSKKRLTAAEALEHPWIVSTTLSERVIANDRSALATSSRRARMSSMAIDNVKDALDLENDPADDEDAMAALSRGFDSLPSGEGGVTTSSANDPAASRRRRHTLSSTSNSASPRSGRLGGRSSAPPVPSVPRPVSDAGRGSPRAPSPPGVGALPFVDAGAPARQDNAAGLPAVFSVKSIMSRRLFRQQAVGEEDAGKGRAPVHGAAGAAAAAAPARPQPSVSYDSEGD